MQEGKDENGLYFCLILIAALGYMILFVFAADARNASAYWEERSREQSARIIALEDEKNEQSIRISELERTVRFMESWQYIGEFKITYYWPGEDQYGSITSTGAVAEEGRTAAVDSSIIPYGSEVLIDGHIYIAEDCGAAVKGNVIDIYVNEPKEEMYYTGVYIKR